MAHNQFKLQHIFVLRKMVEAAGSSYWGSAPPPAAKLPEPPRSHSLRSFSPEAAGVMRFFTNGGGGGNRTRVQLLGLSAPSSGEATGAFPLNAYACSGGVIYLTTFWWRRRESNPRPTL